MKNKPEDTSRAAKLADFQDFSKTYTPWSSAPPQVQINNLAEHTGGLADMPQHTHAVTQVVQRAKGVLDAAMPTNPSPSPMGPGQDTWEPSPGQLHTFSAVKEAVLNPKSILEQLGAGEVPHPAAWGAFQTVYPELAKDLATQTLKHISEHNDAPLSQRQKAVASLMVGHPLSAGLQPGRMAAQQQLHALAQAQAQTDLSGPKPRAKGEDKLGFGKAAAWSGSAPGAGEKD